MRLADKRSMGFDIRDLIDGRRGNGKGKRGKVAVKYRDFAAER
jgi:hypothetical protein